MSAGPGAGTRQLQQLLPNDRSKTTLEELLNKIDVYGAEMCFSQLVRRKLRVFLRFERDKHWVSSNVTQFELNFRPV